MGWVYAATKLDPASRVRVEKRLLEVASASRHCRSAALRLPQFFELCFSPQVLRFLVTARRDLDWRHSVVDRTLMAFLLVYLHGKRGSALSNQLRQTKSMSPQYAVRWWKRHRSQPPALNPSEFLQERLEWRYAKGVAETAESHVYRGDCLVMLPQLAARRKAEGGSRASLILTSPPYFDLANYHYDQWLRLWLLGGRPDARRLGSAYRGKFENRERYRTLLDSAFRACKDFLSRSGVVYVRTSVRPETYEPTAHSLRRIFRAHRILRRVRPFRGPTQTHLFGDTTPKKAEVDFIVLPR